MFVQTAVFGFVSLEQQFSISQLPVYHAVNCPLSDVYVIYTTFCEMTLLPSLSDCHYTG